MKEYPQPTLWSELPLSGLFLRHVKNIEINGLVLGSEKLDLRVPIIASDIDGLQIQNIGKIANSGADSFIAGQDLKNIEVGTPLGWWLNY